MFHKPLFRKNTVLLLAGFTVLFSGAPLSIQAQELPQINLVTAVPNMAFAAIWAAEELKLFEEEGVRATVASAGGGSPCVAAVVGGSADFCAVSSDGLILAQQQGAPLMAVQAHNRNITLSVTVSKEVVDRAGLTRESPLEDRMKLLTRLQTIGVTSPGAVSYQIFKFLIRKAGGDPDKLKFAFLGSPQLPPSLMNNIIQAFAQSPPQGETTEAAGKGYVLIPLARGEIPELTNYPFEVLVARSDVIKSKPDITRAVCRAISRAGALIRNDPPKAKAALRAHRLFNPGRLEEAVFELAFSMIEPAIPAWGDMNEEGWQKVIDFAIGAGMIEASAQGLSAAEGVLWTNEFVGTPP
jgi:NitT/TauT family transport system substrate-binding protein